MAALGRRAAPHDGLGVILGRPHLRPIPLARIPHQILSWCSEALTTSQGEHMAMPLPSRTRHGTSESSFVPDKDAHAALRRRIRVDTSRTGRTEDAAWGERRPLAAESGEKCGLVRGHEEERLLLTLDAGRGMRIMERASGR